MPNRQSFFSRERIAVLCVVIAALCAIIYFVTRPAPQVVRVVTQPVPQDTAGSVIESADSITPVVPDTVIHLTVKGGGKPQFRHRKPPKPRKGFTPKPRDYKLTPEQEQPQHR